MASSLIFFIFVETKVKGQEYGNTNIFEDKYFFVMKKLWRLVRLFNVKQPHFSENWKVFSSVQKADV